MESILLKDINQQEAKLMRKNVAVECYAAFETRANCDAGIRLQLGGRENRIRESVCLEQPHCKKKSKDRKNGGKMQEIINAVLGKGYVLSSTRQSGTGFPEEFQECEC